MTNRTNTNPSAKKTVIEQLPCPSSPEWVVDLTTRAPNKDKVVSSNLIRFLDYAVDKQAISPDGSVIKYAAKIIVRDIDDKAADIVLKYLFVKKSFELSLVHFSYGLLI